MATFDLEEQEQIDALKQFWRSYGKLIITIVVAAVIAFGGTRWWQHRALTQSQSASEQFNAFEVAEAEEELEQQLQIGADISEQFHGTYYADLAKLKLAKKYSDGGQLAEAIAVLRQLVESSKDEELVAIARLRLASLHLQNESFDEAMDTLDGDAAAAMSGLYADMRGDIYAAQGSIEEAKSAYEEALDRLGEGSPWRDIVQIKIDSLSSK